ncbi:PID-CTERM protein-sorting domain-containing protein [Flavisolibacter nicotianae]|uniref:PID-CTERM protein-sorting domain-containing protein n=1 Tax=Flavisolibacter nicotianae TaxID=2364882 RepID=UPI000EABBA6F|nr:hypothetical protein [Flavisolibacter nicotianae]
MRKALKKIVFIFFFSVFGMSKMLMAQTGLDEPPPTECPPSPDPDTQPDPYCPLDGGLVFLLAAGAVYGVRKYSTGQKKESAGYDTLG